jgi:hypothetical protein
LIRKAGVSKTQRCWSSSTTAADWSDVFREATWEALDLSGGKLAGRATPLARNPWVGSAKGSNEKKPICSRNGAHRL